MHGRVEHLCVAPSRGAPVVHLDSVTAVADRGLEGDRNFGRTRQVTVVCTGELREAAYRLGIPRIPAGATRRNITVSLDVLPRRAGTLMRLGEVVLRIRGDCAPCEVMESSVAPGARAALLGRAGVSATVLVGGVVHLGDPVVVIQPEGSAPRFSDLQGHHLEGGSRVLP